ncbi:MAG: helix-turn-helix domain-containing protein [Desulfobacteraceae bacterium]|nr:helix-turn-helix domain-containing protein [Desulfobacteraceae bacterium]
MDLYEFIMQKVHVDELYDYEIASLLKVSDSMITNLRNAYDIKRPNGFTRRFDRRYGKGAVGRFKKMVENPNSTLGDIGRDFEFSREYARQAYKKIYGCAYTQAYKRKRLAREKKGIAERAKRSKQPRGSTKADKTMKSMELGEETILAQNMTTKEVAKYLRLHEVTVNKYAARGEIPAVRIGRAWRFDKEAIDKWINRGEKKTTRQTAKKEATRDRDANVVKKRKKDARNTPSKKQTEVKDGSQRPIVYKLKKKGKIKSERRGVYVKA